MERLTERTADGILVKENHGENGLRTFYQCFGEKPNDKYTNCDEGYCAIEKLAAYEDAEEQGQYGKWIPVSERLPEESLNSVIGWDTYRNRCCFVQYLGGRFVLGDDIYSVNVTAWMPLPEPYRESEPHKQNKAYQIRSMTDEELAAFNINFDNHFGEEYEGEQSCLSWLQKESEEKK